jgi:DNA repair protein RadC
MERAVSSLADDELIEMIAGAPGSGSGPGSGARLAEAMREALRRMAAGRSTRGTPSLRCSAEAYEAIGAALARRTQERFWVVALDARNRPLSRHLVAQGSLASCMVHPREVFAPLVRRRAAAAILVHNHPSGDPTPSPEDERLTERLVEAGRLLGIPVLDHLVVGRRGYYSFRDDGRVGQGEREVDSRQSTVDSEQGRENRECRGSQS